MQLRETSSHATRCGVQAERSACLADMQMVSGKSFQPQWARTDSLELLGVSTSMKPRSSAVVSGKLSSELGNAGALRGCTKVR